MGVPGYGEWGGTRGRACQCPGQLSSAYPCPSTDGEARTFNGSIELCRADSDSSQKVGPQEASGPGPRVGRDSWPWILDTEMSGTCVPADSPSLTISAGSKWKSVEVSTGGEMGTWWYGKLLPI